MAKLRFLSLLAGACLLSPLAGQAQPSPAEGPYRVLRSERVGGAGGFDYVTADPAERRLYIPRGNRVTVFDLDTLRSVGEIAPTESVHGVAIDPAAHHGFSSSRPVAMWDTRSLAPLRTIPVQGGPDGILFDPATERVFVLSHRAPNATVIDGRSGAIVGTIDLGGAPEQGASDGAGRLYFDIEDKDQVAVVDARSLQVTARYGLGGQGRTPAGLALDSERHYLFVCCRNPSTCVILQAETGEIVANLPLGAGTDGALFNPRTREAMSSQGDGSLTVIQETGPRSFAVEQNVPTRAGAKTCTLDARTNRILLITADFGPAPAGGPAPVGRPRRGPMVPDSFTILAVGR